MTPSNRLFLLSQFLKLKDIYNLKVGLAMHQMLREKSLAANNISLLSNSHNYDTRSSYNKNCYIPSIRTNIGKTSIKYQGPIVWNSIPNDLKSLSPLLFKKNTAIT